jgi:hypothetical protein
MPAGLGLQPMKVNAIVVRKIAVLRMSPYTLRRIGSQLCALTLTLAFFALPSAGIETPRAPILRPLATNLVPLDSGLQSQPAVLLFQHPSVVTRARLALGYVYSLEWAFNPTSGGMVHVRVAGFSDSRVTDTPNGRSPPSRFV